MNKKSNVLQPGNSQPAESAGLKVSIQGYEGSFHQMAARQFFGKDVEVIACATFREVVKIAANKKESNGGVMAIENSIAGSILPNYNLLQKSNLKISGEIYLQIKQNLLVNPGVKLEDIREVHSHSMAIQQCFGFLDKYNWKLVETEDTALSAKLVHQHRSRHTAAIASRLSAELFQLDIIAPNIHTLKNNYTRFLIVQPEDTAKEIDNADKASVNFHTDHSRGSLARVLSKIAEGGINLSKLQSFPIPGSDWKYSFHADMEFETVDQFNKVMNEIRPITEGLKVYGVYKKRQNFLKRLSYKQTFVMQTAKRLEGVGEYYFSQKLREIDQMNKAGKKVINLGIGSPDLPPHPDVISVLHEESMKNNQHGYQNYKGAPVFRKAIADFYKTWYNVELDPESEILPLIGSKEGIMHICMTYLDEGDIALIPNPGYPTYKSAVQLSGAKCQAYSLKEETNWEPDFEEMEKSDLQKVKLMWVNYTHMPTGKLPSKELFEKIVSFGRKHNILICHDNPYSFILNDKPMSLLGVKGAKEIAVELNSLSKTGNMAGWRVGWLAGAKERIAEILRFKSNMDSGMFLPVQLAASKALGLGKSWYDNLNETYSKRREVVYKILQKLDCTYDVKQAGLFIWAKVPENYESGYELSDEILYEKSVFITPGGIFGNNGQKFIRVSLCQNTDVLNKALDRIANR